MKKNEIEINATNLILKLIIFKHQKVTSIPPLITVKSLLQIGQVVIASIIVVSPEHAAQTRRH
jgi:hypothetical protein